MRTRSAKGSVLNALDKGKYASLTERVFFYCLLPTAYCLFSTCFTITSNVFRWLFFNTSRIIPELKKRREAI